MFQMSSEAVVTQQAPIQVAVYGTLKRGYNNHHYLEEARFVGQDMLFNIILYDLGAYPAAKPGVSAGVLVEVYRVDDTVLSALDILEECHFDAPEKGLYRRELVETRHGIAWLYLYNPVIEPGRIFAERCW